MSDGTIKLGDFGIAEADGLNKKTIQNSNDIIGSVHYLQKNGKFFCFDMREPERVRGMIDEHFGGSGIEFAKAYYKDLAELPTRADFDIIGHFDLITKHPEIEALIDTSSKEYRDAWLEAAEALKGRIPYFEVNMGGVARGYKDSPYPSAEILCELKRLGFGAVITSDSHDIASLGFGFDDACRLLDACGFKERYILTDGGFMSVPVLE
jgi:histidinol-phosphatase (PHP family)